MPNSIRLLAEALSISDADKRREVMAKIEAIMQEQGVMIQPYWRALYRHYDRKGQRCCDARNL